jgi:DNA-binding transcriptional regulator GbsR (MarR family)
MVLENLQVRHKAFGEGVVVATSGKYFTVKFETAEKVFVYPDIFDRFLTLIDGTVSDEIKEDLKAVNEVKQQIQNKKDEENLRAMTRGIVIPGKENVNLDSEDEEYRNKQESEEI